MRRVLAPLAAIPPRRAAFFYLNDTPERNRNGVYVAELGKPFSKDQKRLLDGLGMALYAGSASGPSHLLFERDGVLMAQPFDLKKLDVAGEPFPATPQVAPMVTGLGAFSASETGTLAYRNRRG